MIHIIRWLRRRMYRNARVLGDVQAVMQGRIVHRTLQRQLGKRSRKIIHKLTRRFL